MWLVCGHFVMYSASHVGSSLRAVKNPLVHSVEMCPGHCYRPLKEWVPGSAPSVNAWDEWKGSRSKSPRSSVTFVPDSDSGLTAVVYLWLRFWGGIKSLRSCSVVSYPEPVPATPPAPTVMRRKKG